jgi:hypothetical protein
MRAGTSISQLLTEDHRRLDRLLEQAVGETGVVDRMRYDEFRSGLLRHIGMEEKILLPAVQRLQGGTALAIAAKLRLDHGALASLLMPSPTAAVIATIRTILAEHNALEEGPGGLYATCDRIPAAEAEQLLTRLGTVPQVSVMPHSDSPAVMQTVHRAVERAGYRLRPAEAGPQP